MCMELPYGRVQESSGCGTKSGGGGEKKRSERGSEISLVMLDLKKKWTATWGGTVGEKRFQGNVGFCEKRARDGSDLRI